MKQIINGQHKNKLAFYLIASGILAIYLVLSLFVFKGNSAYLTVDLYSDQYQKSLKDINGLLAKYKPDIFTNPLFNRLTSFFKLPLEKGAVGNSDLFKQPIPPDQLLLLKLKK